MFIKGLFHVAELGILCEKLLRRSGSITGLLFFIVAIHDMLIEDLSNGLSDHTEQRCIVCNPDAISSEDEVCLFR